MRPLLVLLLILPLAARAERLTVVELFTSQGCSSCPPADAVLSELARTDPSLLALGMHVTYWDRLGWKDPYSLPAATDRQRQASARFGLGYVYTPQLVVDGRHQAVGSDRAEVRRALDLARAETPAAIPLAITPEADSVRIAVGAGPGAAAILLVGYDPAHSTQVKAGENGGRTLTDANVVRAMAQAGTWSGTPVELVLPKPAGERTAVILQSADGRILGAARP